MVVNVLLDVILKTDAATIRASDHNFHVAGTRDHFDRFGSFKPVDEIQLRPVGEVETIKNTAVSARSQYAPF